jgi:hypothetical protein
MSSKVEQIESKIKDTVEDTKRMVDVRYQVSQHPWAALGLSVFVGYTLGSMGSGRSSEQPDYSATVRYRGESTDNRGAAIRYYGETAEDRSYSTPDTSDRYRYTGASYAQEPRKPAEPGIVDQLVDQFGDELQMLKAAAVTSLISLVRDTVRQNLPAVHQQLERLRGDQHSPTTTASPSYSSKTTDSSSRYYDTAESKARERAIGETTSAQTDAGRSSSYGYASSGQAGEPSRRT